MLISSIFLLIFISGCVQQENPEPVVSTGSIDEGLGNLCPNEDKCKSFCLDNRGMCEEYCKNNENELCSFVLNDIFTEEQSGGDAIGGTCKGSKVKFNFAPVNLDKTKVFLPLGLMVGGHVTPTDHHYFQNFDNEGYNIEIYSPGKGIIQKKHVPFFYKSLFLYLKR